MEATAGRRSWSSMLNRKLCCILEDERAEAVYWFHRDFPDVSLASAEYSVQCMSVLHTTVLCL